MQKRRSPLGERAGQLQFNCPSELAQILVLKKYTKTARAVTYWLSKYCRDAGVTYKSPHCTRRTTASRLSNAGLPLDMIRDILGQVDEKTTLTYIFNQNTEQENLDIMNKAMNKGNKKKN